MSSFSITVIGSRLNEYINIILHACITLKIVSKVKATQYLFTKQNLDFSNKTHENIDFEK